MEYNDFYNTRGNLGEMVYQLLDLLGDLHYEIRVCDNFQSDYDGCEKFTNDDDDFVDVDCGCNKTLCCGCSASCIICHTYHCKLCLDYNKQEICEEEGFVYNNTYSTVNICLECYTNEKRKKDAITSPKKKKKISKDESEDESIKSL